MSELLHYIKQMSELLPLRIDHADWDEATLSLRGTGWYWVIVTSWRMSKEGLLVTGFSDMSAETKINEVEKQEIVKFENPIGGVGLDLVAVLRNGTRIEVFPTFCHEAWHFKHVNGIEIVFVPPA